MIFCFFVELETKSLHTTNKKQKKTDVWIDPYTETNKYIMAKYLSCIRNQVNTETRNKNLKLYAFLLPIIICSKHVSDTSNPKKNHQKQFLRLHVNLSHLHKEAFRFILSLKFVRK